MNKVQACMDNIAMPLVSQASYKTKFVSHKKN